MKYIFFLLWIMPFFVHAQYTPVKHTPINKAWGVAQSMPLDARSYYYDDIAFRYRPFASVAEAVLYFRDTITRKGNFPVFIRDPLGVVYEYSYRSGIKDGDLIPKDVDGFNAVWYGARTTNSRDSNSAVIQKMINAGIVNIVVPDTIRYNFKTIAGYDYKTFKINDFQSVDRVRDRDSIQTRKLGMQVYVSERDSAYRLVGGFTNENWKAVDYATICQLTDTASSVRAYVDEVVASGGGTNYDAPEQTYAGTITWTATTAPSGTETNTYQWSRAGKRVFIIVHLKYGTAGTAVTGVTLDLPSDCPTAKVPSGFSSTGAYLYRGIGQTANGVTSSGTGITSYVRLNADLTTIYLSATFSSTSSNTLTLQIEYLMP